MMRLAIAGGLSLAVSAGLIHLLLSSPRVVERLVSTPVTHRWHTQPTPSFAGVPMFVAFATGISLAGGLADPIARTLVVAAALTCLTGLVDDLHDISPRAKLAGQLLAAVVVALSVPAGAGLSLVLAPVIVAWIVLLSNSVNLTDNMDGLAGSTTAVSLSVVLGLAVAAGQTGLALVAAATVGAIVGFLVFNLSPAKVFMGDAGSLWLGLVLAASLVSVDVATAWLAPIVAVTVAAVPLVDTATVIVSRVRNGTSILRGGRDHLSHRLVRFGLSERRAVGVLTAAAAVSGVVGAHVARSGVEALPVAALLWACLAGMAATLLRVPVYQDRAGRVSRDP